MDRADRRGRRIGLVRHPSQAKDRPQMFTRYTSIVPLTSNAAFDFFSCVSRGRGDRSLAVALLLPRVLADLFQFVGQVLELLLQFRVQRQHLLHGMLERDERGEMAALAVRPAECTQIDEAIEPGAADLVDQVASTFLGVGEESPQR